MDQVNGALERRGSKACQVGAMVSKPANRKMMTPEIGPRIGTKFRMSATVPHKTGSPTSVAHITKAVATQTNAFMRVIVMR